MKAIKQLLFGKPLKGEPISLKSSKPKFKTAMPNNVSYFKWYRGEWIHHIIIGNR